MLPTDWLFKTPGMTSFGRLTRTVYSMLPVFAKNRRVWSPASPTPELKLHEVRIQCPGGTTELIAPPVVSCTAPQLLHVCWPPTALLGATWPSRTVAAPAGAARARTRADVARAEKKILRVIRRR